MAQQVRSGSNRVSMGIAAAPEVTLADDPLAGVKAKAAEGARPDEFDEAERALIGRKAFLDDEARIQEAIKAEGGTPAPAEPKTFGVFADSPQKFVVVHECLTLPHGGRVRRRDVTTGASEEIDLPAGEHPRRGDEITYRELCAFDTIRGENNLHRADYSKPLAARTKANVDRLIALGAIRPLVALTGA